MEINQEGSGRNRESSSVQGSFELPAALLTALAVGIAALALPWWLGHANPSGVAMVDGVAVHSADATGAKLRGDGYAGAFLAAPGVKPGSDRTRQFVVGLHFFCVEEGHEAELASVRAVPRAGTPQIPSSGVLRRLAPASVEPGEMRVVAGFGWDDPTEAADDLGTWHDLAGAEITGTCSGEDFDAFDAGGEEVVAVLEVGQEGIDVERFEVDALVDGKPYRLLVEAEVAVCGTVVRSLGADEDEDDRCDDMDAPVDED